MPFCKACGDELGDPAQELHDPDNDYEIVEGGASNPDSAHLKVIKGEKGARLNCTREKTFTKIVNEPPNPGGSPSGGGEPEPKQSKPKRPPKKQEVYDLPDEKGAMDILQEVAGAPVFELNDAQVRELISWGDIYDGQIPPDQVEAIIGNFSGISKQTANLIKQKYEAKLNRWMQKKARDNRGPSLNTRASKPVPQPQPSPQPSNGDKSPPSTDKPTPPPEPSGSTSTDDTPADPLEMSKKRRSKRQSRRQEMMDQAMDEFAAAAAQNMAGEVGKGFTEMRDIFFTLIKNKAKKDPDWFFEKMDEWDMDILDDFLSMSEARQQELAGGGDSGGFSVDMDIDNALDETLNSNDDESDTTMESGENTKRDGPISDNDNPMKAAPDDAVEDEVETDEDEVFDEIMGDMSE